MVFCRLDDADVLFGDRRSGNANAFFGRSSSFDRRILLLADCRTGNADVLFGLRRLGNANLFFGRSSIWTTPYFIRAIVDRTTRKHYSGCVIFGQRRYVLFGKLSIGQRQYFIRAMFDWTTPTNFPGGCCLSNAGTLFGGLSKDVPPTEMSSCYHFDDAER